MFPSFFLSTHVEDFSTAEVSVSLILFMDIDKKKAFLSKRRALKGEKIYLDDDLTPAQVAHNKKLASA